MKLFSGVVYYAMALTAAFAQGTAFTYQGRLTDGGTPANGAYDLQFVLRDSATNQVGPTLVAAPVPVAAGQFTVTLDFGAGALNGAPRWLEIGVRTNGSVTAYTTLSPRQALTATPYAVHALVASNVVGNIGDSQLSPNIARLSSTANFIGQVSFSPLIGAPFRVNNATLVTNLNADLLDGLDSSAFAATGHVHAAGDITSGTLADARLSANVALLSRLQTFTASNTFTGVLTASNGSNSFGGRFTGDGGALTNLNAANLAGLVSDSRLSTNVARLGSNQTFTGGVTFNPPGGAPFAAGNTNRVTNLNADLLDGLSSTAFWNLNGNSGATNANFAGTLDNQPLEFRVNNARVLRLIPTLSSPNILAGSPANAVASNAVGATVSGGGLGNTAGANYATVAGGNANTAAGAVATVSGGLNNAATNFAATVPGGSGNVAGGQYSFAAGQNARATHDGALVWADASSIGAFTSAAPNTVVFRAVGGVGIGTNAPQSALHVAGTVQTDALKVPTGASAGAVLTSDSVGNGAWIPPAFRVGTNATSPNLIGGHAGNFVAPGVVGGTIGGGGTANATNQVTANYGTVAGGAANQVAAQFGTVSGGESNAAQNAHSVVAGGRLNTASGQFAVVAGGQANLASGTHSLVGGGRSNRATQVEAVVIGGSTNVASGVGAFVGGGLQNTASGLRSFVGGGWQNQATNSFAAVSGGAFNNGYGYGSSVGGGNFNTASGLYSTVPGGQFNVAGGQYSLAAGQHAVAQHDGSFVWADYASTANFASTTPNQFLIRAAGGMGIGTAAPEQALSIVGGLNIDQGMANDGTTAASLTFGSFSGEGIGSKRTAGGNLYGLDFYTWYTNRMSIANNGNVAIGTNATVEKLEVFGSDATVRIRNQNETAGGFIGNTAGALQLGLYNPSASVFGVVPANTKRSFFGFDNTGKVGSLANNYFSPVFRNLLDDGNGNMSVSPGGSLSFGATRRQMLNLWQTVYGIGVQDNTHYSRSDGGFAWFNKGVHSNTQNDPGAGGTTLMTLAPSGLTVSGSVGIGGAPFDAVLDVEGPTHINDNDIFLRGGTDRNHGLGWYGSPKLFAGVNLDGPVLYGWTGGALATKSTGDRIALSWNNNADVGIGTTGPGARLHVASTAASIAIMESPNINGTWFGLGNTSSGGRQWSVISSGVNNGEGPGRLLFFTSQDNSTKFRLEPNGDLWIAGTLSQGSDRNRKENFKPVNPREVLDRVAGLQIQNWNYKDDEYKAPHIGPMAQDFHAAFGVGKDDKSIATVDADGVALAAIQGLNEIVKEKEAKITSLEKRLSQLEQLVQLLAQKK